MNIPNQNQTTHNINYSTKEPKYKLYFLHDKYGQIFYVGVTERDLRIRKSQHISDSKRKNLDGTWKYDFYNSRKLRTINWEFEIFSPLSFATRDEMLIAETKYIEWCRNLGFKLTNLDSGGKGGKTGFVLKEETKEKLRQLNLGPLNPMYGRVPSQESREAQRQKMKGRVPLHFQDPERKSIAIAKMKASFPERHGEHNANFGNRGEKSKLAKVLLQLDEAGKIVGRYVGLKETARQLGISERCIRKVITGEKKTYLGYQWKYLD